MIIDRSIRVTMPARAAQWGNRTFNTSNACLEITAGSSIYQAPVDDMTDSAVILDRIIQVAEKTWPASQKAGDLTKAHWVRS